jgi:hypothetical protein
MYKQVHDTAGKQDHRVAAEKENEGDRKRKRN